MTDNGWSEHKREVEHRLGELESSRREQWREINAMDRRIVRLETKVALYAAAAAGLVAVVVEGVKLVIAR